MSKKRLTWYKMMPADLLANKDIERMDVDEFGVHMYLVQRSFLDDGIPADFSEIIRYSMLRSYDKKRLREIWENIKHLWVPTGDGRLVNAYIESQKECVSGLTKHASEAGKASAAKKKQLKSISTDEIRVLNEPFNGKNPVVEMEFNNLEEEVEEEKEEERETETAREKPLDEIFERCYSQSLVKRDRGIAERKFSEAVVENEVDPELIERQWKTWNDAWAADRYAKKQSLAEWLRDRHWEFPPPEPTRSDSRGKPSPFDEAAAELKRRDVA